jgi:hypothetical protein
MDVWSCSSSRLHTIEKLLLMDRRSPLPLDEFHICIALMTECTASLTPLNNPLWIFIETFAY